MIDSSSNIDLYSIENIRKHDISWMSLCEE